MKLFLALLLALPFSSFAARFSIAHMSDTHAMYICYQSNFTGSVNFILNHTNDGDLNIVGSVLTGDCYEQSVTNYNNPGWLDLPGLTNGINTLITNGVFCLPIPGNHDADTIDPVPGTWSSPMYPGMSWTNIFPLSWYKQQTNYAANFGFVGSLGPEDSRQVCFVYTNNGTKLIFANYHATFTNTCTYAELQAQFAPQTTLITNWLSQYPDHNAVLLSHYMLAFPWTPHRAGPAPKLSTFDGTNAEGYTNLGPSTLCWDQGIYRMTNAMLFLSGHTRSLKKGHIFVQRAGGFVDVQCFNLQAQISGGLLNAEAISIITFDTLLKRAFVRTFNVTTGEEVPNYSQSVRRIQSAGAELRTNVFKHRWSVPYAIPRQKAFAR